MRGGDYRMSGYAANRRRGRRRQSADLKLAIIVHVMSEENLLGSNA
jgi:hypothetical protein